MFKIDKRLLYIPILVMVLSLLHNCSKDNSTNNDFVRINLPDPIVTSQTTNCFLQIEANCPWSISLSYKGDQTNWCSSNINTGNGNANIILNLEKNSSQGIREVTINVSYSNGVVSTELTQNGTEIIPPKPNDIYKNVGWMELPSGNDSDNTIYISHRTNINGKDVRNYSAHYDKNTKIAYWVAYPHHPSYIGSTKRTDNWQFDPSISAAFQPNYYRGISSYDRGHQIPSADRTSSVQANSQTFYYTNITPQMSRLNQDMWAKLEDQVRGWMSTSDTLYVVTGAILRTVGKSETINYANDADGNRVAVPNYYYKVLLRLKNGTYSSIGFWLEHKSYGNIPASVSQSKSVADIESLTGFTFFHNLPQNIAESVKKEWNPTAWGL